VKYEPPRYPKPEEQRAANNRAVLWMSIFYAVVMTAGALLGGAL